jgi:hypothetical protein
LAPMGAAIVPLTGIAFERVRAMGITGRVTKVEFEMRIGIVSSGKIGTTVAQLLPAGHQV